MKIQINVDDMKSLYHSALANDNLKGWCELALDWMTAINDECIKLQKQLKEKENE